MNKLFGIFVISMFLVACENQHEKCLKYAQGNPEAIASCNAVQIDKQKTQLQRCLDSAQGKEGIDACQKAESDRQQQETYRAGINAVGATATSALMYNSLNKSIQQPETIVKKVYVMPQKQSVTPKVIQQPPKKTSSFDVSKFKNEKRPK